MKSATQSPARKVFSETNAWAGIGAGWQPLHGRFRNMGFSFEWHDFVSDRHVDWGASFHPASVELCLNLDGHGTVESESDTLQFSPGTAGFYRSSNSRTLKATRSSSEHHRFLTVEFSRPFLASHLGEMGNALHPVVSSAIEECARDEVSGSAVRLSATQFETISSLRQPPVNSAAQPLWYKGKALELAATFLGRPAVKGEMFCTRQHRLAQERVEQAIALLRENLVATPSLDDLSKKIGCSRYYLSRIFSAQTGKSIPLFVRQLRMERAAELLRAGKFNVTEAALDVGNNSLSHFSVAFHEVHGCCPALYPLKTVSQRVLAG